MNANKLILLAASGMLSAHSTFAAPTSPTASLKALGSFSGTTGAYPLGSLVRGRNNESYGTTSGRGPALPAYGNGTVFKVNDRGGFQTIYSFTGGDDGGAPYAGVTFGPDGALYGTTYYGGAHSCGTLFRLTTAGVLTTLHSFADGTDGCNPLGGVAVTADGTIYGTTYEGGSYYDGTAFSFSKSGGYRILHSFGQSDSSDGTFPNSTLVIASDGNLYGTTQDGGPIGADGTVFRIGTDGSYSLLHGFVELEGAEPSGLSVGTDGFLYGANSNGGPAPYYGTLYRLALDGTLTVLHTFNGSDGRAPLAPPIQTSDGMLYGTTGYGGVGDLGTIYSLASDGTISTLYSYSVSGSTGYTPHAALLAGPRPGTLYGTSMNGGYYGYGTVFKVILPTP